MFDKTYEQRLVAWVAFRYSLERSKDPIQDVIDCYNTAPTVSIHTNAWDQKELARPLATYTREPVLRVLSRIRNVLFLTVNRSF